MSALGRAVSGLVIVGVLLLGMIPRGYMPTTTADGGFGIILCLNGVVSGAAETQAGNQTLAALAELLGEADGGTEPQHPTDRDAPCAFKLGKAMSLLLPFLTVWLAILLAPVARPWPTAPLVLPSTRRLGAKRPRGPPIAASTAPPPIL